MKNNMTGCIFAIFLNIAMAANAQKLPNVQQGSVRAPADIKIDGKATEWHNQYQAYNHATDIFYTLSNDDDNIYLIIKADYHDVTDKILRGGVTLTINHTLAKKDKAKATFTFPSFAARANADITNMLARKENEKKEIHDGDVVPDDLNKMLGAEAKIIKISGIKQIADDSISVYNELGIKAVSQFNKQLNYIIEMAIPIKYLMLNYTDTKSFSYNIKINPPDESQVIHNGGPPPPPLMTSSLTATDFWGEYTLAKK